MNSKERLRQFIDYKGLDYYPFEKAAGLSNGSLKKATGISSTSLEKIHKAYPELNMDWVITGRGEMINENKKSELTVYQLNHLLESMKMTSFHYGETFKSMFFQKQFSHQKWERLLGMPYDKIQEKFKEVAFDSEFRLKVEKALNIDFSQIISNTYQLIFPYGNKGVNISKLPPDKQLEIDQKINQYGITRIETESTPQNQGNATGTDG